MFTVENMLPFMYKSQAFCLRRRNFLLPISNVIENRLRTKINNLSLLMINILCVCVYTHIQMHACTHIYTRYNNANKKRYINIPTARAKVYL
jgi:hypothetical protein